MKRGECCRQSNKGYDAGYEKSNDDPLRDRFSRGEHKVNAELNSLELPLTECEAGEEGEIVSLDTQSSLAARLRELGLVPGARVRVARGGSPLIVEVGAARLCLRGEEAEQVRMRIGLFPDGASEISDLELAFDRRDMI